MASQALLKAVLTGRPKQARLLLHLGADPDYQDDAGQTPLIHALQIQDPRMRANFLRILLQAGADVGRADTNGRNALMWAARTGTCDDVALLLEEASVDFDVNARDNRGQTALWAAADADQPDIVRVLVEALQRGHQPLDVGDHQGVSPAMRAAIRGHVDCLNIIIGHDDPFGKIKTIDTKNLPGRRNVLQLLQAAIQNGHQDEMDTDVPKNSRPKSAASPKIKIISANGQHVLTLPQNLQQEVPQDGTRNDISRHSGRAVSAGTRVWCQTPCIQPLEVSPMPSPVPKTPDGRVSRFARRSASSRRAANVRSYSGRPLNRMKQPRDDILPRERTWTFDSQCETWTDLGAFKPGKDTAGRSSVLAGIFASTPDSLSTPAEPQRKLSKEVDISLVQWPWPTDSIRETLPLLYQRFGSYFSESYRRAAVKLPSAPSLAKTLRIIRHAQEKADALAREQAERERLEALEEELGRKGSSWSRHRYRNLSAAAKPMSPAASRKISTVQQPVVDGSGSGTPKQEVSHFA